MPSESTYENIILFQSEEVKHFRSKKKVVQESESKDKVKSISMYYTSHPSFFTTQQINILSYEMAISKKIKPPNYSTYICLTHMIYICIIGRDNI